MFFKKVDISYFCSPYNLQRLCQQAKTSPLPGLVTIEAGKERRKREQSRLYFYLLSGLHSQLYLPTHNSVIHNRTEYTRIYLNSTDCKETYLQKCKLSRSGHSAVFPQSRISVKGVSNQNSGIPKYLLLILSKQVSPRDRGLFGYSARATPG